MNVKNIMTPDAKTVLASDSILQAGKLLKENGFKHLPVLDGSGSVVGVITDRDIKKASASDATTLEVHELLYLLDKLIVKDVMSGNPVTVAGDCAVSDAARLMVEKKIGCLPVVENGSLKGIVTRDDLLRLMAEGNG